MCFEFDFLIFFGHLASFKKDYIILAGSEYLTGPIFICCDKILHDCQICLVKMPKICISCQNSKETLTLLYAGFSINTNTRGGSKSLDSVKSITGREILCKNEIFVIYFMCLMAYLGIFGHI